jgi:hypothetical protein
MMCPPKNSVEGDPEVPWMMTLRLSLPTSGVTAITLA